VHRRRVWNFNGVRSSLRQNLLKLVKHYRLKYTRFIFIRKRFNKHKNYVLVLFIKELLNKKMKSYLGCRIRRYVHVHVCVLQ